ncbi:peptidoglycan-binding domain-containing protein [Streptomyces sp. NPDC001851]|uniref:peptidoglycan-binding domain-containing protein n=1 Tax=Streptomyces sp. NPDC001851 TaxID=3154529 RepID=UPI00332A5348
MSIRTKAVLAITAVALTGGLAGAPAASAATSPTVATSAGAATTYSCNVYWRETANYAGYTAGYSWAWNDAVYPGHVGDRTVEIQCQLKFWGYNPGPVDGDYGTQTTDAVKSFQSANGLTGDGIVGQRTWPLLRGGYAK